MPRKIRRETGLMAEALYYFRWMRGSDEDPGFVVNRAAKMKCRTEHDDPRVCNCLNRCHKSGQDRVN
jgi:hypothetical protein